MPKQVKLVRNDGSSLVVDESKAANFVPLGYRPETDDERATRQTAASRAEHTAGTYQKLLTGAEGLASGATFGTSDALFSAMGFHTADRAEAHPDIRTGTELGGAIIPAFLAGPETLVGSAAEGGVGAVRALEAGTAVADIARGAEATGALSRTGSAARALAGATPSGMLAKATQGMGWASRGALEGAAFGLGGQISRSSLTDDPFTAEAVLHSLGWGGLFGVGMSGLGAAVSKGAGRLADGIDAGEAKAGSRISHDMIPDEHWTALRAEAEDIATAGKRANDEIAQHLKDLRKQSGFINKAVQDEASMVAGPARREYFKTMSKGLSAAYDSADKAVLAGRMDEIPAAIGAYRTTLYNAAAEVGVAHGLPGPLETLVNHSQVKKAVEAFAQATELRSISEGLKGFPRTPEAWTNLSKQQADVLHDALDRATKVDVPYLKANQEALKGLMADVPKKLGVSTGADPTVDLAKSWTALRDAGTATTGKGVSGGVGFFGKQIAKKLGLSVGIPQSLTGLVLRMKGNVMGHLKDAASRLADTGALVSKVGGRLEPLRTRLDGTKDTKPAKDRAELFERRRQEVQQAVPGIKEVMFRALQPLAAFEPGLAKAVHASAVNAFTAVFDAMPRSRSTAFAAFKPLKTTDPVAVERFARIWSAFHHFHDSVAGKLGHSADLHGGLQKVWPASMIEFQGHATDALMSRAAAGGLNHYGQLAQASYISGAPLHSAMTSAFIVAQQTMFQKRNTPPQPNTGTRTGQSSSGGGRPAATEPTAGQKATEQ